MSATIDNIAYAAWAAFTSTNLQSMAIDTSDPFAAWQSDRIDNRSTLADDWQIQIHLPTAATSPANDQAVYLYVIPWDYNGSAWVPAANFGTIVLPTGTEGTASISDPNSMKGPLAMPYKVTSQIIDGFIGSLANFIGGNMPPGFSLAIRNNCGAALSTGCVVSHRSITYTNT